MYFRCWFAPGIPHFFPLLFFVSYLPVSVVPTRHTLRILPHLCFLCRLSYFNVFLFYNCLFLSTTSLGLTPSLSAPTHLLSALIFILSCSSPLLLSSLSHSFLFPSFPSCLFHPSFSHMLSSLTPLSACWDGNRTMPVRRGVAAECHFYIVFTLPLVRMWESAAMFGGRKYVAIFVTDTQLKVIQWHHFTLM